MKILLSLFTLVFIQFMGIALADPIPMTKEIYQNKILGNTLLGATSNGAWKVTHKPNSPRLFYSATGYVDEGKIWFKDGGIACAKWNKIYEGSVHCSEMFIDGDQLIWTNPSDNQEKAKIMPGDYSGW